MNQEAPPNPSTNLMAIASLVLGVLNLMSCCIPCCGLPMAGIGLGLGIAGLKSEYKNIAIIGVVLNGIGVSLSLGTTVYGTYFWSGQHSFFSQFF